MPAGRRATSPHEDGALLMAAAREAGDLAMWHFRRSPAVWEKSPGHPVTEADLQVDAALYSALRGARANYGWLSEETGEDFADRHRERVFVVDPIDGTRAFMKGEPFWCIGLAVLHGGKSVAGVIYNPVTQEMFHAVDGEGAFLNDTPIRVSACNTLSGCRMIAAEHLLHRKDWASPWPEMEFADPRPNATLYRMALVAAGRWDATVALWRKSDWDLAPGEVLVREAGGLAGNHDGTPFRFNQREPAQKSLLAAGPGLHPLLKERLSVVALPDPNASEPSTPPPRPASPQARSRMTRTKPTRQLLHLVFGGKLKSLDDVEFENLRDIDFVGAYGSYAEAYDAWKSAAQRTVDHAGTRYFILHAHRLLDPETGDQHTL